MVGWGDLYEVSDHGEIRSLHKKVRILKPHLRHGYNTVSLHDSGSVRYVSNHIETLLAFTGTKPPGMQARHLDCNKLNNHISNLAWGTPQENMNDSRILGLLPNQLKTVCKYGHLLNEPNLVLSRPNARVCLACSRARAYIQYPPNSHMDLQTVADQKYQQIMEYKK